MKANYTGTHATFRTRFEYFIDRMMNVSTAATSKIYLENFEEVLRKMVSRAESNSRNLVDLEKYVDEQLRRYAKFDAIGRGTQGRYDALSYTKSALEYSRVVMMDRISILLRHSGGRE